MHCVVLKFNSETEVLSISQPGLIHLPIFSIEKIQDFMTQSGRGQGLLDVIGWAALASSDTSERASKPSSAIPAPEF